MAKNAQYFWNTDFAPLGGSFFTHSLYTLQNLSSLGLCLLTKDSLFVCLA